VGLCRQDPAPGEGQPFTAAGELRVCAIRVRNSGCLSGQRRYCERMSKAKKLLHTRYRVDNLERTVGFYKTVLGLEEVRRHKSPRGSELVFLKAPGSEELIELCSFPASGPVQVQPDLTHLAFEVESLEQFGKHLTSLGIKYSDGPHMRPEGGGIAFIDAPEGYEIELIELSRTGPGY
jgi:lactoylglutathione lyase